MKTPMQRHSRDQWGAKYLESCVFLSLSGMGEETWWDNLNFQTWWEGNKCADGSPGAGTECGGNKKKNDNGWDLKTAFFSSMSFPGLYPWRPGDDCTIGHARLSQQVETFGENARLGQLQFPCRLHKSSPWWQRPDLWARGWPPAPALSVSILSYSVY